MTGGPKLFTIIRSGLSPVLASIGLEEVTPEPSSRNYCLHYQGITAAGRAVALWFQRDIKASMTEAFGSSFTVELQAQVSPGHPVIGAGGLKARKRLVELLTAKEWEELRHVQNTVIERLIARREAAVRAAGRLPFEYQCAGANLDLIDNPYPTWKDVWMRYRIKDDVLAWTAFLAHVIPLVLERFLVDQANGTGNV
jgi:hypothetical protein